MMCLWSGPTGESWLLCLVCLPSASWWLCGSSLRCHGFVCGLWLQCFLIILTILNCWISFTPVFSTSYVLLSPIFVLSPISILICVLYDTSISYGSFMQTKHLFVLIHIRSKGEVGTIKYVSALHNFLTDRSRALLLLICYLCLSVILSFLLLAVYCSPAVILSLSHMVFRVRYGTNSWFLSSSLYFWLICKYKIELPHNQTTDKLSGQGEYAIKHRQTNKLDTESI